MRCYWKQGVAVVVAVAGGALVASAAESSSPRAAPVALTLEDCLRLGVERSLTLANARRDQDIAEADIRQVRAQVLPSLAAEGHYAWVDEPLAFPGMEGEPIPDQYQAWLRAEQLLYSGGAVRAALAAARHYRDGAGAMVATADRDLTRAVAQQFYAVLQAEAAAGVALSSLALLEGYAAQMAQKAARGMASEFDLLTAQVRVANERPVSDRARNAADLARSSLRTLLNLDAAPHTFVGELTAPTNTVALESLYAQAFAQRPELAAAEAEIHYYTARLRVERSAFLPELRAFATYTGDSPNPYDPTDEEWRWGWRAGGSATWSLLDGGLRRGKTRAMALEVAKAEASRDALRNEIRLEVEQAHLTLENARVTLGGSAEAVRLAGRALVIARTRVEQGMATYLELTDANVALSQARQAHVDALTACRQAWIQLQFATGGDVAAAATEKGITYE